MVWNFTFRDAFETRAGLSLFTALNCVTCPCGALANGLVIVSVAAKGVDRTNANILLLLSLSAADLLVSGVFQPLYIYRMNSYSQRRAFIRIQTFLGHFAYLASVNSILMITAERLVAIFRPLRYFQWMTQRRANAMIWSAWLASLGMAALRLLVPKKKATRAAIYLIYAYMLVAMLVVVVCTIAVYVAASKQTRRIRAVHQNAVIVGTTPTTTSPQHKVAMEYKATRSTLIIIACYLLAWLPHVLCPIFISNEPRSYARALPWLNTLAFTNSFLNPLVYCYRYRMFRQVVRKFYRSVVYITREIFVS